MDSFQTHNFFSGSAGNRTRASGSVAKNSDHRDGRVVSPLMVKPDEVMLNICR
jgi:hypothetical protein